AFGVCARDRLGQFARRRIGPAQVEALRQDHELTILGRSLPNGRHCAIEVSARPATLDQDLRHANLIRWGHDPSSTTRLPMPPCTRPRRVPPAHEALAGRLQITSRARETDARRMVARELSLALLLQLLFISLVEWRRWTSHLGSRPILKAEQRRA